MDTFAVGSSELLTRTPRRVGPPTSSDETTSFGANDANAELANASVANAATASVMVFFIWFPLRVSATGGDERADCDPMDLVVSNELCFGDRVVVTGGRDDLNAWTHERVDLVQVRRRCEERRPGRVLACMPQGVDHRVGHRHPVEVVDVLRFRAGRIFREDCL